MEICRTKQHMRETRAGWRGRVALVPTMGFLHEGHLSLIRHARRQGAQVVVSIFVNPTQFGRGEDLESYPRDPDRDLAILRQERIDAVFMPAPEEMYHPDSESAVEAVRLSRTLIGRIRPTHFRGVATVVTKLFNIVQPDIAVFGQKDYQQLCVIRTIVRDLDIPVRIDGVATMREPDGLALSSRNVRLTPEHRAAAPALHDALLGAEEHARRGWTVTRLTRWLQDRLDGVPGAQVASIDIREAGTLAPLRGPILGAAVILLAVRFGEVLLIDNRVIGPAAEAA